MWLVTGRFDRSDGYEAEVSGCGNRECLTVFFYRRYFLPAVNTTHKLKVWVLWNDRRSPDMMTNCEAPAACLLLLAAIAGLVSSDRLCG